MRPDLAVDGGQTGLRVAVVQNAERTRTLTLDGFTYSPQVDSVADDAAAIVTALRPVADGPRRVVLGLTNAPAAPADRARLAETVRTGLDADDVLVTSDMVTAHVGALGGADGVVVAAGTGAVALARSGDQYARSDGFGYLLGDDGSGFAVGRAGLRAALRAIEGRGPATALVTAMHEHFAHIGDFPHGLYRRPDVVPAIAGFTPEVAAAARTGDKVARAIWAQAVDDLVESVRSVVARCSGLAAAETVAVSYCGGLFRVTDLLTDAFAARVPQAVRGTVVQRPIGDALDGAQGLLSLDPAPYGELVARSTVVPA